MLPKKWKSIINGREALFWLAIALSIRLVAGIAIHVYSLHNGFGGFYPLASGHDDIYYWNQAHDILGGEPVRAYSIYPYVLSVLFSLTGPSLIAGKLLSVLAGALTVYFGVALVKFLVAQSPLYGPGHPAPHWAGCFLSCYPAAIFYSTQMIRDPILILFGVIALYLAIQFLAAGLKAKRWLYIPAWLAAVAGMYSFRPYAAAVLAAAVLCYVAFFQKKLLVPAALAVAAISLMVGFGLVGSAYLPAFFDLERIAGFRENVYSIGGSAAGIVIDYSSPTKFLATYLYSYMTVLGGPFPWQLNSLVHYVALPEAALMWLTLPIWIAGLVQLVKGVLRQRFEPELILLLFSLAMIGAIAIFSDNIGANTRLRLLPWTSFLLFLALKMPLRLPFPAKSQQRSS